MNRKLLLLVVFLGLALLIGGLFYFNQPSNSDASPSAPREFSGERALQDVISQVKLGPRIPGSDAHKQTITWIQQELKKSGWTTEIQTGSLLGHPIQNVIGKRGSGTPWIILGAHFDTRMKADQDPNVNQRTQAVPGANDGASGVAVLLELARALPQDLKSQVWLVFFDVEDQGDLPGWDWILGSRWFASQLTSRPDAVVIVDMIGDADLNIYKERTSNQQLVQSIWSAAEAAGYQKQFIPQLKYSMEDDHTPFLQKGFNAADLIDFDYPYWHTVQDTPDKVSAESLKAVGETLFQWINSNSWLAK
jgi:Zn-dependent M28 family amino/carboxypeptidase